MRYLTLTAFAAAAACGADQPIREGVYDLAIDAQRDDCPPVEPAIVGGPLVLSIVEIEGDFWAGEEMSTEQLLEGWFEGGGAVGGGQGVLSLADGGASLEVRVDTDWRVELYGADDADVEGRFVIEMTWPSPVGGQHCALDLSVRGHRL